MWWDRLCWNTDWLWAATDQTLANQEWELPRLGRRTSCPVRLPSLLVSSALLCPGQLHWMCAYFWWNKYQTETQNLGAQVSLCHDQSFFTNRTLDILNLLQISCVADCLHDSWRSISKFCVSTWQKTGEFFLHSPLQSPDASLCLMMDAEQY